MELQKLIKNNSAILMEAAVVEILRRSPNIKLHRSLVNTPLIYSETGRFALRQLYSDYISIAKEHSLPIFLTTPTWRSNKERVIASGLNKSINRDAVDFLKGIRDHYLEFSKHIKIGGLIGCKNDCYKPEEGLSEAEAEKFHEWQINELVAGGVDYLIAETLPNLNEALGIAKAMEKNGTPYFISFVINRDGNLLDGNNLTESIDYIDRNTSNKPLGYLINCAYPTFLNPEKQDSELFKRLIGFNANASSLDHCELDNSSDLKVDNVKEWGDEMIHLHKSYGFKMLGGCCGTGTEHLNYIVNELD